MCKFSNIDLDIYVNKDYIGRSEDAILISNKLNLKLSNLSPTVLKCGFPYNSLDKYMQILSRTSYNIKIIDISKPNEIFTPNEFEINKNIKELLEEIAKINIDDISIKEAYSLLEISTFK